MRQQKRRPERNAGAFLGPDLLVPVPMRTLSDEYHDAPAEPEDSDREPEPEPRSRARGLIEGIRRRLRSR
jgi:hypothetical protein